MGTFADPGRTVTLQVDRFAFTALGDKCQFPNLSRAGFSDWQRERQSLPG